MRAIKLYYWKGRRTPINYGDLLSPYIIHTISGCSIQRKDSYIDDCKVRIRRIMVSLLTFNIEKFRRITRKKENVVFGIGSILKMANPGALVWGAGFMSPNELTKANQVFAVRGVYTLNKLPINVKKDNIALGDPALLLPLIIGKAKSVKHVIGIIPHYSEYNYFKKKYSSDFHIIDLKNDNIKELTEEITSCQYIFSSSLHGLIVPLAYGIPALWIEHSGLEEGTNGFKFKDFFSSVGISEYESIKNLEEVLGKSKTDKSIFSSSKCKITPEVLHNVQLKLLKAAPFYVNQLYFEILNNHKSS